MDALRCLRITMAGCVSVTEEGEALLQHSGKQQSTDRAVEPQTPHTQRPLHLSKSACKVFINSFHGNAAAAFGTLVLVGNVV